MIVEDFIALKMEIAFVNAVVLIVIVVKNV